LIIPFCFLLLIMEILAFQQYHRPATFDELRDKMITGVPILSIFIFYTNRYKRRREMQTFLFALSIACGIRMVHVVNVASWLVVMQQCPPLATLWIYTVVQLNLFPAVLGLMIVGTWMKWKNYRIIFQAWPLSDARSLKGTIYYYRNINITDTFINSINIALGLGHTTYCTLCKSRTSQPLCDQSNYDMYPCQWTTVRLLTEKWGMGETCLSAFPVHYKHQSDGIKSMYARRYANSRVGGLNSDGTLYEQRYTCNGNQAAHEPTRVLYIIFLHPGLARLPIERLYFYAWYSVLPRPSQWRGAAI